MLLLVLVALASACTATPGDPDASGDPQATTPDGVLRVILRVQYDGPMFYVEGAIPVVEVLDPSGDIITSASGRGGSRAALREPLTPGDYLVRTFLRPCGGDCGSLGEPTDVCALPIEMPDDGSDVVVSVQVVAIQGVCDFSVDGNITGGPTPSPIDSA